jgi:serine/threonine protein kinase
MQDTLPNLSSFRAATPQATRLRNLCDSGGLFQGRYRLARVLGRGGFGITYLAQDRTLPGYPLCVIKQLSPKVANPIALERARVRFKREARILGRLGSHSQIPMLLDYFIVEGQFYLVQEYIQGDTLSKEVRRNGTYKEPQVKRFLREVLSVLKYVHQQGVIHRDIKPPNLLRCAQDGRLVLIDFGTVREQLAHASEGQFRVTNTQFVGTMGFAPPEQIALRPCFASDIYALGITCLYLMTGRTPIEFEVDPRTHEISWQHSVQVSRYFEQILTKMLRPNAEERFQNIEELERALAVEPYAADLSNCLNTVPQSGETQPPQETVVPIGTHMTAIQRQAAAIRRLRSRHK